MATQRFFERYRLLSQTREELRRADDFDGVLEVLRRRTRAIVDADGIAVVWREGDTIHYVGEDAIAPLGAGQRFPIRFCMTGLSILIGAPIAIADVADDERVSVALYLDTFVRSIAIFPVGSPSVAALALYWREPQPLGRDVEFLASMLAQGANLVLAALASHAKRARPAIAA